MRARKKKHLRWHLAALDDLIDIMEYIAEDVPERAIKLCNRIRDKATRCSGLRG